MSSYYAYNLIVLIAQGYTQVVSFFCYAYNALALAVQGQYVCVGQYVLSYSVVTVSFRRTTRKWIVSLSVDNCKEVAREVTATVYFAHLLSSQHFFRSLDMAKRQVTSVFPHRSPCLLHESSHSKVLCIQ